MKRVAFLTGGTGFVGANLARTLIAEGWEVRALARAGSDARNLEGLPLQMIAGDLNSPHLVEAMRGADAVFHVAAHYSLARRDRDALIESNVAGTRNVLASARRAGVERTVYTSSVAAIGVRHDGPADERFQSDPDALIGHYKRSKYLAERVAMEAAADGQNVVIVNPTTPIGAWDRKPTPTGELLVRFLSGRLPVLVATGLNFVDVDAVARGHLLAYNRGVSGERYILGDENLQLRDFIARIAAQTGQSVPKQTIPWWLPLPAAYVDESLSALRRTATKIPIDGVRMSKEAMFYDSSKARRDLGFAPGSLDRGIAAAIAWFSSNGYLPNGVRKT